ncbi:MAG: response regulator transcription factor [Thermodesulfobacteriota bacterium]
MRKIPVIIVDDHKLFRQSLKIMISKWEQIEIAGETGDWQECLRLVQSTRPKVAILDISMPGLGGIELAPRIRKISPLTQVLILSMHGDSNHVYRAFKAGCRGFVLKSDSAEELEAAILTVAKRNTYLSPATSSVFINKLISQKRQLDDSLFSELTQREQEIGRQLIQRRTTTEIGRDLSISPKTVRVHITNMLRKLGCASRDDLRHCLQEMLPFDLPEESA